MLATGGMLEYTVSLAQWCRVPNVGACDSIGPKVCDVSSAPATEVHSIDNYVALMSTGRKSAIIFGVLNSTSSSGGQAAIVAGDSDIYTFVCRVNLRCLCSGKG